MSVELSLRPASDPPGAAKIRLESLSVAFGKESSRVLAVSGIDLEVFEGEFLCLMGPSGCGKTTILNVIAGFLEPSSGCVQIDGRNVEKPGPDRTVVFQEDAVFRWMTVEGNIAFGPRALGKSKREVKRVVDRYLELVGLTEFRGTWPAHLSGGMRKRVDLARGFAADPDVLLLDEPFGSLDLITKEHLQVELYKLWLTEPRTVLMVTHDLEEALFLGDRVVVLTPRPARIAAIYEPGFPQDRKLDIKTTPAFIAFRRQIRELISAQDKDRSTLGAGRGVNADGR